jgi:hypothetical protein
MTEPLDQSGMQLPEISREEILKQIFGDIGELIDGSAYCCLCYSFNQLYREQILLVQLKALC